MSTRRKPSLPPKITTQPLTNALTLNGIKALKVVLEHTAGLRPHADQGGCPEDHPDRMHWRDQNCSVCVALRKLEGAVAEVEDELP